MPAPASTAEPTDTPSWEGLVRDNVMAFGIDVTTRQASEWRLQSSAFLDTTLFAMTSGPHAAERTQQHVRENKDASCVVTFQLSGTLHLTQFDRRARLRPGQFAVYTSDAPVRIEGSSDYRSLSLKIPLARFGSAREELHQLGATAFNAEEGLAPAVKSFLGHLNSGMESISRPTRAGISHHVVGMVEQLLRDQDPALREPPLRSVDDLRERCIAFIEANLSDPGLSPQTIADSAFISTRYLHQLFSPTGITVARYVRKRRLEMVRADLACPARAGQTVEQVILRWGVQNVSYFGQVFKEVEGCTPTEFRTRALGR